MATKAGIYNYLSFEYAFNNFNIINLPGYRELLIICCVNNNVYNNYSITIFRDVLNNNSKIFKLGDGINRMEFDITETQITGYRAYYYENNTWNNGTQLSSITVFYKI